MDLVKRIGISSLTYLAFFCFISGSQQLLFPIAYVLGAGLKANGIPASITQKYRYKRFVPSNWPSPEGCRFYGIMAWYNPKEKNV
jgi:hypothetical protein